MSTKEQKGTETEVPGIPATETEEARLKRTAAEQEAYLNEKVEITLFYDGDKYKDEVQVGVNGKMWVIQRGVPVQVPRKVAFALQNSAMQDNAATRVREGLINDFNAAKKALE